MVIPYSCTKRDSRPEYSGHGGPGRASGLLGRRQLRERRDRRQTMRPNTTRQRWTSAEVPDQQGRTAVITGANTGLGFQTAKVLAQHGATVVLACRNPDKAAAAAATIGAAAPTATVSTLQLDLASQASVRRAADNPRTDHRRIDLLINNAGGTMPRHRLTEDGYELTLATNHLGPFALTGLLLDRLVAVPGSRIVTVSSIGHRRGTIN